MYNADTYEILHLHLYMYMYIYVLFTVRFLNREFNTSYVYIYMYCNFISVNLSAYK